MSYSESIAQLLELIKIDAEQQFSVAWVQRKLKAGYGKACAIRDQMINQGLIEKLERISQEGGKEFCYVLAGEKPKQTFQWFESAE